MSQGQIDFKVFGRDTSFQYSTYWLGYALIALRLLMGWTLFSAGVKHVLAGQGFVRATNGLLRGAAANSPFGFLFDLMVPFADILAPINAWALVLTGAGIMLGGFFRLSAFGGGMLMLMYWMAGLPLEDSFFVNSQFIYVFLLFGLGAAGAGRIFGVDQYIEDMSLVQNNPWLKYLLG